MSSQRAFRRKVIYGVAMAPLLGVLYWLGSPMTTQSPGGKLAQVRDKHGLNESSLGEIDPAGETMKLATLGMRGVATNILWSKAQGYQMRKDWTNLAATLDQISHLEPHFIAVWRNQAWNLSYNISVEFDDYRQRYRWVIRGIEFMMRGVDYNENEPRLYWDVAWFTAHKIGNADEHVQFRRMFRADDDFHNGQTPPSTAEERDNWLFGKKWFGYAENLAKSGASLGGISEVVFFSNGPMCQMNYAVSLEEEGIFGEKAGREWGIALTQWVDHYGGYEVASSYADADGKLIKVQLNRLERYRDEVDDLTEELEAIEPGLHEEIRRKRWSDLSDEELGAMHFALTAPAADRSPELSELIEMIDVIQPNWREELLPKRRALLSEPENAAIDTLRSNRTNAQRGYFEAASRELYETFGRSRSKLIVEPKDLARGIEDSEDRRRALRLADEIEDVDRLAEIIAGYRRISNYEYWRRRAEMEQTAEAQAARKAIYEGKQKLLTSLPEANEKYVEGLLKWSELLAREEFQNIENQQDTGEEIVIMIDDYDTLLGRRDELFPEDFPLQDFVLAQIEANPNAPIWETRALVADAKQALAKGDHETARAALPEAIAGWGGMLEEFRSLMRMSNRTIGAEILTTIELYGEVLAENDERFPETFSLRDFLHLQVEHSEQVAAARQATAEATLALQDSRSADAQNSCDQALAKWREVLDRFPSLLRDSDKATTAELVELLRLYEEILQRRDKSRPDDFILQDFVDLHSAPGA